MALEHIEAIQRRMFAAGKSAGIGRTVFLLLLLLLFVPGLRAETKANVVRSFTKTTSAGLSLTDDIRRGLNIDERVLHCFTSAKGDVRIKDEWFEAAQIDLDGKKRPDWIVHSKHPCLESGNSVRWWVFQSGSQAQQNHLLLAIEAERLDILQEKAGGFHIIRTEHSRYRYSNDRSQYIVDAGVRKPSNSQIEGNWEPRSKALVGLGALTILDDTLEWSICKNARIRHWQGTRGTFSRVTGTPGCRLDQHPVRYLQIKMQQDTCKAEISVYSSEENMSKDEPLAWGIIERTPCH